MFCSWPWSTHLQCVLQGAFKGSFAGFDNRSRGGILLQLSAQAHLTWTNSSWVSFLYGSKHWVFDVIHWSNLNLGPINISLPAYNWNKQKKPHSASYLNISQVRCRVCFLPLYLRLRGKKGFGKRYWAFNFLLWKSISVRHSFIRFWIALIDPEN